MAKQVRKRSMINRPLRSGRMIMCIYITGKAKSLIMGMRTPEIPSAGKVIEQLAHKEHELRRHTARNTIERKSDGKVASV